MIIVLFSIIFTINIGIGTYFICYKYMNRDKETLAKESFIYQTIIWLNDIDIKLTENRQKVSQKHWYLLHWIHHDKKKLKIMKIFIV